MKARSAIGELLRVMARLRSPNGCPWDREQTHQSLRYHAVEEVYELMDAIEAGDDHEMLEELGDLLLQIVFHCQLARERGAFNFEQVARHIADKLIRRHPHVFGDKVAKTVEAVWAQWEQIKRDEKKGTRHERPSAFDGIPKHLPALLQAEKLIKKARKAGLPVEAKPAATKTGLAERPWKGGGRPCRRQSAPGLETRIPRTRREISELLFELTTRAQQQGWSAEELLRAEFKRRELTLRRMERTR